MNAPRPPRPPQVTVAVGLGLFGAAIFVIALLDSMGATYSLGVRTALKDLLTEPPYDSLGMTVDEGLRVLRTAIYGMGVAAAIAFVLSFYVLRRNNAARIGFTIAAALLLPGLLGTTGLGISAMVVAMAAGALWSAPARDWFAGRTPQPSTSPRPSPGQTGPTFPSRSLSNQQPPPTATPYGVRPTPVLDLSALPPPTQPPPPPRSVVSAVALTRLTTVLTAFYLVTSAVLLVADRDSAERRFSRVIDEAMPRESVDLDAHTVWVVALVLLALGLLWCVGVYALTYAVLRRREWARSLLLASIVVTVLMSLLAIVSLVSLIPLIAAVLVARQLLSPAARSWFAWRPPTPL